MTKWREAARPICDSHDAIDAAAFMTTRIATPIQAPVSIGVSTWVWTSPATTAVLETLLPHIAALGFDVIELPIEDVGQFDVARVGELAAAHGLDVSVCAVIGAGRDLLVDGEAERGVRYLEACID